MSHTLVSILLAPTIHPKGYSCTLAGEVLDIGLHDVTEIAMPSGPDHLLFGSTEINRNPSGLMILVKNSRPAGSAPAACWSPSSACYPAAGRLPAANRRRLPPSDRASAARRQLGRPC